MLDKRKFYIDGKWVEPATSNDLLVLNPATEKADRRHFSREGSRYRSRGGSRQESIRNL